MSQLALLDRYDPDEIDRLQQAGTFFWLDLEHPELPVLQELAERFDWHEMLRRDLHHGNQRPKLDEYAGCALLVFYGLDQQAKPQEVQLVISGDYVISVHQRRPQVLAQLRDRLAGKDHVESYLIYRILDALTDSFFPVLEDVDANIDALEDAILAGPQDEHLAELFDLKHRLVAIRRISGPQRDLAARTLERLKDIDGLESDGQDWYRDVYDHMLRVSESVNDYRDLLSGVMDLYLSTVSNRLNVVMKQLTILTSIFLPLSLLTGFFGMNFPWLVDHLQGSWIFFGLGLGSMAISGLLLWGLIRRLGWNR